MRQQYIRLFIVVLFLFFLCAAAPVSAAGNAPPKQPQLLALEEKVALLRDSLAHLTLQRETVSQAYAVVDLSNNSVIAQKNNSRMYPIASITKLMTAVIATENIDASKTIALTPQMLKPEGASPSLYPGLTISAEMLLKACLIQSVNDAAQSLTYFIGNKKFLALMNKEAKVLGMNHTYFYDAYGVSPRNRSTAGDVAKLLGYVYYHHPEILAITKEDDFWLPDAEGKLLHFQNVNNLYASPDFIGAKAGYIPQSKQTLASLALVNGRPVAIVLLRSRNRKADALRIVDWLKNNSWTG